MEITRAHATSWAGRYFLAWQTNDRATVESLFSEDAVYFYGPFRPPARGREAIVERWLRSPQAGVTSEFEVVAVEPRVAVVHWRVVFESDGRREMDGVLIVRFDAAGLCCEHREWYAERTVAQEP
jgi:ketosteroid isomerase-like protein